MICPLRNLQTKHSMGYMNAQFAEELANCVDMSRTTRSLQIVRSLPAGHSLDCHDTHVSSFSAGQTGLDLTGPGAHVSRQLH